MLDVGLIGTGAIGSKVIRAVADGTVPGVRMTSVYNRNPEKARAVVDSLDHEPGIVVAREPLGVPDRADVVIETAGQEAIEEWTVPILETGTDLIAMSVGPFHRSDFLDEVQSIATANDARVHVPSGSIAGLDGLGALGNGALDEIMLVCYRPREYMGPYVDAAVDVDHLQNGTVVFEGTAAAATTAFPENMNVAITVALTAKVDPREVLVRIEVEESAPRARYVVRASGDAGAIDVEILNLRIDTGTETSHINVYSILECLRRLLAPVRVGT